MTSRETGHQEQMTARLCFSSICVLDYYKTAFQNDLSYLMPSPLENNNKKTSKITLSNLAHQSVSWSVSRNGESPLTTRLCKLASENRHVLLLAFCIWCAM